jgi:hypothetical protein
MSTMDHALICSSLRSDHRSSYIYKTPSFWTSYRKSGLEIPAHAFLRTSVLLWFDPGEIDLQEKPVL